MKTYVTTKIIKAEPEVRGTEQGFKVVHDTGLEGWMPHDTFLKECREDGELTFSQALHALLTQRKTIARKSWNAPGQFIIEVPAGNAAYKGYPMQDCLAIKNAQGLMQPGWVPSQGDLFAEDWYIVGER